MRDERNDAKAVEEIATSSVMLAEVQRSYDRVKSAALTPGRDEEIREVVARLFPVFPQPEMGEVALAEWWNTYLDALEDVPLPALEAGVKAWGRQPSAQFLPKPGELRALALATPNTHSRAVGRALSALRWEAPREPGNLAAPVVTARGIPEPTAQDKARVRAMAAAFLAQVPARPPAPVYKGIPAPVDEKGVSYAWLAAMERRA